MLLSLLEGPKKAETVVSSVTEADALCSQKSCPQAPRPSAAVHRAGMLRAALLPHTHFVCCSSSVFLSFGLSLPVLKHSFKRCHYIVVPLLFFQISGWVFFTLGQGAKKMLASALKGCESHFKFSAYSPWKSRWTPVNSTKKAIRKKIPLFSKSTPD